MNDLQTINTKQVALPGLDMSREQFDLLKRTYAQSKDSPATDDEFWMYVNFCKARGVSVASQEIYFSKFGGKVNFLTSYHHILAKCQETGQFEGMTQALFCASDGVWKELWLMQEPPIACKVGVYRKGYREAVWTIRYTVECTQPNPQWKKQPLQMLRKCAIADALRLAFDDVLRGIYITEEMPSAPPEIIMPTAKRDDSPKPITLPDTTSERWEFSDVPDCFLPSDLQGKAVSFERLGRDENLFYTSQGKQTKARAILHRWATGQNWPEALREIGKLLLEKFPSKKATAVEATTVEAGTVSTTLPDPQLANAVGKEVPPSTQSN